MSEKPVTKTQLRDFVDLKILGKKRELYEEIKSVVTERLGVALSQLLGDVKELERTASKFEDILTEKIHLIGSDGVLSFALNVASHANKLCNVKKYFLDQLVDDSMHALLGRRSYYRFKSDGLVDTFNAINKELAQKTQLYTDGLDTLKSELHNAISNESSGKRAYNALIALGVDMSGLPEANPNLPAVVKLSVDVCVLNGDCKESA